MQMEIFSGRCLESVGIMAGDTRDDDDQHLLLPTFLPLSVDELLFPSNNITPDGTEWYWKALWWPHHPVRAEQFYIEAFFVLFFGLRSMMDRY